MIVSSILPKEVNETVSLKKETCKICDK